MAFYKNKKYLEQTEDPKFDEILGPRDNTPYSGIYRCEGCGREIVSTEGNPLPPQNHHQHNTNQGDIRWKMIIIPKHTR